MKKIVIGIIIAVIIALVLGFIPLMDVPYTVMVDYQDNETYYVDEPYEVTETYYETEPLDYEVVKTSGYIDNETPVVSVTLRNTDTTLGMFNVHFTIKVSCMTITQSAINMWSTEYVNDKGLYLEPEQTKTASYHADDVDVGTCDWSWNYVVTPDTKTVEKQRTVTKYRQVEKERIVTKERPETHYKKVPIFEYLISRF